MSKFLTPEVVAALASEDAYCQSRWKQADLLVGRTYDERSIDEWILYMEDYLQEARHQATRGDETAALHTLRKVVNMGVTCMAKHGAFKRSGF